MIQSSFHEAVLEAKRSTSNIFKAVIPILPLVLVAFFAGFAHFYLLDPFRLENLMGSQTTDWIGVKH
jgi:hypothetical protein